MWGNTLEGCAVTLKVILDTGSLVEGAGAAKGDVSGRYEGTSAPRATAAANAANKSPGSR